jgi:tyrosine-protein kinase Etk/Wzc
VEESKPGNVAGALGDVASLFEIHSPASAEIEILRSRLVVGQAVQNLQLDLSVTPKYVPLVGRWLARRATGPSDPGFLGMDGYISGNETLKVVRFDVPAALQGERFSVVMTAQGYELLSPDDAVLGKGAVGQRSISPWTGSKASAGGRALGSRRRLLPGASSLLTVTEGLQRNLNIEEQGRQSGVLRASLEGIDPTRIAHVLNEIGSLYVRQNVERKSAEAEKSLGFLGSFLPQLREQLEDSEKKFNKFRNQKGTFDPAPRPRVGPGGRAPDQLARAATKAAGAAAVYPLHPSVQAIDAQIRASTAT